MLPDLNPRHPLIRPILFKVVDILHEKKQPQLLRRLGDLEAFCLSTAPTGPAKVPEF